MTTAPEGALTPVDTKEELRDEFLGALTALGGSAGNGRLREILERDDAGYEAVKAELLGRRLIVPGRGPDGSKMGGQLDRRVKEISPLEIVLRATARVAAISGVVALLIWVTWVMLDLKNLQSGFTLP